MARTETIKMFLTKSDKSGFVFGAISLFFIGIAFLFTLFVNIGAGQESTRSYIDMLLTGFFGAFAFATILGVQRKRKTQKDESLIFEPMSVESASRQLGMVLPIGIMAGVLVTVINLAANISGNLLLGSAFGPIDPTNFSLGLLAGVAEELFFRGFLQSMFELFMGGTNFARFVAPVPTALIFAWFHFFAYQGNNIAFFVMFAIGLGLGYTRALTRDMGVPILAHVINNSIAMISVLALFIQQILIVVVIFVAVIVTVFVFATLSRKSRRGR
jgi:membrane protease YdiL (CAAX protease family)